MEKLQKLKNVKIEKQKTTKFTFFVKPYVKNDIFEKKIILVNQYFLIKNNKIENFTLEKLQKLKNGKIEK